MSTDLGKIGIKWRGDWASGTTYEEQDLVKYDGNVYISIRAPGADVPGTSSAWDVFVYGGTSGGGEPSAYLKAASVTAGTLTLTQKDGTEVTYTISVGTSTVPGATTISSITINGTAYNFPSGGTSDYNDLSNKPAIDGVELSSTTTLADIGAAEAVHTHQQTDITGLSEALAGMVMQVTDVTTVTSNTLTVEPGKAYDWKPTGLSLVIQLAEGVDCTKAWSSLIRLNRSGQSGSWWNTTLTAFGYTMTNYLSGKDFLQFFTAFSQFDGSAHITPYKIRLASHSSDVNAGGPGIVSVIHSRGFTLDSLGYLTIQAVTNSDIDTPNSANVRILTVSTKNRAVRSVLPLVTVIPAAVASVTLYDASATTNNYSCDYTHSPTSTPTYTLPDVTGTTIRHTVTVTVAFSSAVTSCSFQTADGTTIPLHSTPTITATSVIQFLCEYDSVAGWIVYPLEVRA